MRRFVLTQAEESSVRIDPEDLGPVNEVIFGENRRTGPTVAERIGTIKVTLWSWLNRRGLPVEAARRLERELEQQEREIARARKHLRRQINAAVRATATAA